MSSVIAWAGVLLATAVGATEVDVTASGSASTAYDTSVVGIDGGARVWVHDAWAIHGAAGLDFPQHALWLYTDDTSRFLTTGRLGTVWAPEGGRFNDPKLQFEVIAEAQVDVPVGPAGAIGVGLGGTRDKAATVTTHGLLRCNVGLVEGISPCGLEVRLTTSVRPRDPELHATMDDTAATLQRLDQTVAGLRGDFDAMQEKTCCSIDAEITSDDPSLDRAYIVISSAHSDPMQRRITRKEGASIPVTEGTYTVTVTRPGFKKMEELVRVRPGADSRASVAIALARDPRAAAGQEACLYPLLTIFDVNSAVPRTDGAEQIGLIASCLQSHPELALVEVRGFASPEGSPQWNQVLSQRRAEAIVEKIVMLGIAPDRLVARGYGASESMSRGQTEYDYRWNRRVDFRVLKRDE